MWERTSQVNRSEGEEKVYLLSKKNNVNLEIVLGVDDSWIFLRLGLDPTKKTSDLGRDMRLGGWS